MSIFLTVNRLLCLVFCLQQMEDPVCLAVCVPIWMWWASEDCQSVWSPWSSPVPAKRSVTLRHYNIYVLRTSLDYTWISASFTCQQRQQICNALNTCIWQLLLSPLSAYMHAVMVIFFFISLKQTKQNTWYLTWSALCARACTCEANAQAIWILIFLHLHMCIWSLLEE